MIISLLIYASTRNDRCPGGPDAKHNDRYFSASKRAEPWSGVSPPRGGADASRRSRWFNAAGCRRRKTRGGRRGERADANHRPRWPSAAGCERENARRSGRRARRCQPWIGGQCRRLKRKREAVGRGAQVPIIDLGGPVPPAAEDGKREAAAIEVPDEASSQPSSNILRGPTPMPRRRPTVENDAAIAPPRRIVARPQPRPPAAANQTLVSTPSTTLFWPLIRQ